jgi:hypothetical protein
MTCPRAGVKTPGTTGPRHGTWTAWTWIADHPHHGEGAATIGLELVDTVPSFYAVLIAFGGGALATGVGHPEHGQQAPEQHAMGDHSGTRPTPRRSARVAVE